VVTNRSSTVDSAEQEIARIRLEYARRKEAIPATFYGWQHPVNQFFHFAISRVCISSLVEESMFPLSGRRVLDVGCGRGTWLLEFAQWGVEAAQLYGIDLDQERIDNARKVLLGSDLRVGDGQSLPWPASTFDLVTQFTVFSSVLSREMKRVMAGEMVRVLKPGGIVLWYDLRRNNPSNANVCGIGAHEIRALFPGCRVKLRSVTLAPPLARYVAPRSWPLSWLAEAIPFLRTHYLAVIHRNV
jgi:ubiquinone/menaquinone biosynthesis C-methylase UbiE